MTERPILFSAPMVRAIRDGSKTQTRRAFSERMIKLMGHAADAGEVSRFIENGFLQPNDASYIVDFCPYGQPGDRLWVREACADIGPRLTYRADTDDGAHCKVKRWTPSIHMPRWASRILLEIASVRVERLNDISEVDSISEGIERKGDMMWSLYGQAHVDRTYSPRASFRALWSSINGAASWDANPFVWVVEFRRIHAR